MRRWKSASEAFVRPDYVDVEIEGAFRAVLRIFSNQHIVGVVAVTVEALLGGLQAERVEHHILFVNSYYGPCSGEGFAVP